MGISEEAAAFIAEREAGWVANPPRPKNLTRDNIGRYRNEHRDDYMDNCERALSETGAQTDIVDLGRVRTLKVTVEESNAGAALYFFGGAFVAGGPDEDVTIMSPLADQLGLPIYGPFYPLSPESVFPEAIDVGLAAYQALLEKYSAREIAIVGESAGASLATTVTLKAMSEGLPAPACLVPISPASDLGLTGHSATLDLDPTMKPAERWDLVMELYVGTTGIDHPLISPIHANFPPGFPPTLITTGTRDFLLSDCVRLHQVMRTAAVDVSINVWDGMWHVFEHFYGIPEAAQSLSEIADFIRHHIGAN